MKKSLLSSSSSNTIISNSSIITKSAASPSSSQRIRPLSHQQHDHLMNKLHQIDQKITTLTKKSLKYQLKEFQDQSYVIDTKSIQTTICPNCFNPVNISELRVHLQKDCHENMIPCPELGCGVHLPKNEMKNHLQYGCKVAKARRLMAKTSIKRKEDAIERIRDKILNPIPIDTQKVVSVKETTENLSPDSPSSSAQKMIAPPVDEYLTCTDCHEKILYHDFPRHLSICSYRRIYCPNRYLGCKHEVSLVLLDQHLTRECEIEQKKDQLIQNSKKRLELVQCPGCGDKFPLGKLRKHEQEECNNRKVPCRNAVLGCSVMVRLKDRKNHEDVHSSVRPRSCLYFDGCDTQIVINEDDIAPPWTIEFWIYRPSVVETARCYLRDVLRLGDIFRNKLLIESRYRIEIMSIKTQLQEIQSGSGKSRNVFLNPEFTETTLKLAKMIPEYEKLALETILYGQLYFVAIKSAETEIELGKASRSHRELLDITPEVDGVPCKKSYHQSTLTTSTKAEEILNEVEDQSNQDNREIDEVEEIENVNGLEVEANVGEPIEVAASLDTENDCLPEGFDDLTTRMIDFDWNPKLWKEWGKQMKDLEDRYEYDQEIILQWRISSGLINDPNAGKKSNKSEDKKSDGKRLKQERRNKREKKYKINKAEGESKFSELAKNILAIHQGSSILCHSDKSNIFLHLSSAQVPPEILGPRDEIEGSLGYCDWLHGLVSFQYTVPREKWTHIAINATVEPKKRVYFYSDGVLMSTIKEKVFNLPMKAIGSSYLSFQGYILDVRYWGKSRSLPEIKLDMRCLLHLQPSEQNGASSSSQIEHKKDVEEKTNETHLPDLSGNNLIGWWTMEDGGFSRRVRDVSDHRFPSVLTGGKIYLLDRETLWFEATSLLPLNIRETLRDNPTLSMNIPQISLPLPSYLEKNLCPFEIRRSKLAQRGRALLQYVSCPNHCHQHIRKINLRNHLKFECSMRLISCRYEWCSQSFPAIEENTHYLHDCAMVKKRNIFYDNFLNSNQQTTCTLCSKSLPLKELLNHESNLCRYRTVSCRYDDCHAKYPYHMRRYHEIYECSSHQIQYKKWLIERARSRSNYPRPWGIEMTYGNENDDANPEGNDIPPQTTEDNERFNLDPKEEIINEKEELQRKLDEDIN